MKGSGTYLARRVLQSMLVIVGASVVVFLLSRLTGDPAALMLSPDATDQELQQYRERMGLDRPIYIQYADFAVHALQGDFGKSLLYKRAAMKLVLERLPASLKLTVLSIVIGAIAGLPLGAIAAMRRGKPPDFVARALAVIGLCFPSFFMAIVLILLFSVRLRWFPASGGTELKNMILPAFTLSAYTTASTTRLFRSSLLEVLNQEYVRTARSKGLHENAVFFRHIARNAAIPVVTLFGLRLGELLGRAIVTETVFNYPGLGRLALQAIQNRDFVLLQSFILVSAIAITVGNLIADILYTILDPRIKYN
ncbi:ABC transporter permease [Chloroflexota bacterium]